MNLHALINERIHKERQLYHRAMDYSDKTRSSLHAYAVSLLESLLQEDAEQQAKGKRQL